jgi:hypothetical protein
VTVSVALPSCPSLVAVICEEPAASAVTRPVAETLATPVLLDDQVTVRPVRTLLFASYVVAVPCALCPTVKELSGRETVTDATGAVEVESDAVITVSAALPLFVPRRAMTDTDPTDRPVTSPVLETTAMVESLVDHVTTDESCRFQRSSTVAVA